MYSNLSLKNNYALMESALNGIEGLDTDTVRAIIDLHKTIYAPQFESADGVASAALSTGMNGYFIGAGAFGLVSAIGGAVAAVAGAPALGITLAGLGVAGAVGSLIWSIYDGYGSATRAKDEASRANREAAAIKDANAAVEKNLSSNPFTKYATNAAKRTSEILSKTGGTLFDKVDAVGQSVSHVKEDNTTSMDDDDFEEKYGFTKDLQIVDATKALNHSLQFYFLMNGMNENGNKVIDKKAYAEFQEAFEDYWEEHRDLLPYLNEKAAKAKMFPEFVRHYYTDTFMPAYKRKLVKAIESSDENKSVAELEAEGRDEFGTVVDKNKYYASMGFSADGKVTDIQKFSNAFMAKTGLDLSYNPVSPEGHRLLERMMKDPSSEYLKYLPAPVFLMTEEDQKPFIEKAKDPDRRGESQFGRYGSEMVSAAGVNQAVAGQRQAGQEQQVGRKVKGPARQAARPVAKQAAPKQDITDSPDVMKQAPQWRTVGKAQLAQLYGVANDRAKHLMRLGYIMNIKDGKFYRMSDEDKNTMSKIVFEEMDRRSHENAQERRQVALNQGRLTRAEMTQSEIDASNKKAGFPQGT